MMTQTSLSPLHRLLATAWAQYHGQKGTEKQVARIANQLSVETLTRMLSARGITVQEQAS